MFGDRGALRKRAGYAVDVQGYDPAIQVVLTWCDVGFRMAIFLSKFLVSGVSCDGYFFRFVPYLRNVGEVKQFTVFTLFR